MYVYVLNCITTKWNNKNNKILVKRYVLIIQSVGLFKALYTSCPGSGRPVHINANLTSLGSSHVAKIVRSDISTTFCSHVFIYTAE